MRDGSDARKEAKEAKDGWLTANLATATDWFGREIWQIELAGQPRFRAGLLRTARILYLAVQGLLRNDCTMQAGALTYITVLSLVPMLALGFSVAKGFGAYDVLVEQTIEPALDSVFGATTSSPEATREALGLAAESAKQAGEAVVAASETQQAKLDAEAGAEAGAADEDGGTGVRKAIDQVLAFVSNTNFSNLGLFGLGFLLLAAIKLLTGVEKAFNRIWGVTRARSMVRKLTDYVAMVVITPIALLLATAVTGALRSNVVVDFLEEKFHLGPVVQFTFKLLPLLTLWFGFSLVYMVMPNTRVPFLSALLGGIVGGSLWQLFQIAHVEFQVGVARYNAIYSGFAAFPIFLVWVFVSWVTVLLGAQVAWAHHVEPELRERMRIAPASVAEREALMLRAVRAITRAFLDGSKPETSRGLATRLSVTGIAIDDVLQPLVDANVVNRADHREGYAYFPGRDPSHLHLAEVLDAWRGAAGANGTGEVGEKSDDPVLVAFEQYNQVAAKSDANLTLSALAEREGKSGKG